MTTAASTHPCEGDYRDKPRPSLHWLRRRKPFSDPEPGCVYIPIPDDEGLQIGRANDAQSYFNLTLSRIEQEEEKNQLVFGIGFVPDPTKKARFESAVFKVAFGYDGNGKRHQMEIRDISPKEERGDYSEVHFGRESEGSVQVSLGKSAASLAGGGRLTTNAEYTRKTPYASEGKVCTLPSRYGRIKKTKEQLDNMTS
ncbi:hypothetical protein A0H81_00106 [Grifola frondosa]|uniref:Uncharacterized protein n=1 Tax=Grifola frondosa TaxID=5627 RepID=A0A1C7MSJ8_GRIFR|nr:hypothetical protein A0H81_00106 [Grifola frondosa]